MVVEYKKAPKTIYLLFDCTFSGSVGYDILKWLGSSSALSNNLVLHAHQFIGPFSLKKELRDCFRAIWLACAWMICSDHNNIIWLQGMSSSQTIDRVKIPVWSCIKAKQKTFFL